VFKPSSPEWDKAVKLLTSVQKDAIVWPASPAGAQVQQALSDAIARVQAGQQTPAAALKQAQQQAQRAIDQAAS
jgi:multiple sugar transport system substrate-binding protein